MKRNSLITTLLAGLLVAGGLAGLLTSGGVQLILFVFEGKASIATGMLILLAKFAFYCITGIMILMKRNLGFHFAYVSGLVGIMSGLWNIVRDGWGQPQLTYLLFHGIFLGWFIAIGVRRADQPQPSKHKI